MRFGRRRVAFAVQSTKAKLRERAHAMSDKNQRHGLAIGIERVGELVFISLKASGKLTHTDYQTITPMIERALEGIQSPRVKFFVDASELEGWEARAAWDDFKIGARHRHEFEKIALVGNKKWQELAMKVGNWFVQGESKYFDDSAAALAWLGE